MSRTRVARFESADARLKPALSEMNETQGRLRVALPAISALATVICLLGHLGAIGLVGPDEPRYVWIARAMTETGDWVTPRLYGQPWFEKPVLYYWAAAAGFRLHLPAEWAARLPSALATLAVALAVGWLGWKHYGSLPSELSPALLAPLLFSTSVAAIGFARAATPDMLFSASIALAMASAATMLRHTGVLLNAGATDSRATCRDAWPLVFFGLFLGLGVLAKGPAAVALAAGAIGLWALATRQWRAAFRAAHPLAIAAFCVVALPWYVICALRNPDFLRVFLLQHNVERYVTPMFQHRQPFWFFGPIVLLALLPWTTLLWPVAQEGLRLWREKHWTDSPGFFFACWAVFPILFFSLSQSKLPGYVLPAIAPLALLCSVGFLRAFRKSRATATKLAVSVAVTCVAVVVVAMYFARRFDWNVVTEDGAQLMQLLADAILGATILIAAGLVVAGYRRNPTLAVGLCALWVALSVETASLRVLPLLDYFYSARPHAEFMRNDRRPDRIFTYQLRRSWNYGLAFYFRRELPEWSPSDPQPALVLTSAEGAKEIRRFGRIGGLLDEHYAGILYVPVTAAAVSRQ